MVGLTVANTQLAIVEVLLSEELTYTFAEQSTAYAIKIAREKFKGRLCRVYAWEYVGRALDGGWKQLGDTIVFTP